MSLVVDASVAAKWFFREAHHADALRLLDRWERLCAPELVIAEVAGLAWKRCRRAEIAPAQARAVADAIGLYLPRLLSAAALSSRALDIALAFGRPLREGFYLACAEQTGGVLITADRALCAALAGTALAGRVAGLGEADALGG